MVLHFLRGSDGQLVPSRTLVGAPPVVMGGEGENRLAHFSGWEAATSAPCSLGGAPADLGTSIASPVLSTVPGLGQFVPELTLRRGVDGPQIVVTWAAPIEAGDVTAIRVLRRQVTYPANEGDGTVLYSGAPTAGSYSDLAVPPGEVTFYAVWAQVSTLGNRWVTHPHGRAEEIPLQTGFWALQLLHMLGDLYGDVETSRRLEGFPDTAALEQVVASAVLTDAPLDAERFNFAPASQLPRGAALSKLLAILGPYLDEIDGLIHALSDQFDPRLAGSKFLPRIAEEMGFRLNSELSVAAQRREILGRLPYLRAKGQAAAIVALVSDISGLVARVEELCSRVLVSAAPRHLGPPRPKSDTDPNSWGVPPGALGVRALSVVVTIPCTGFCLDDATSRKVLRAIETAVPVCTGLEVLFEDGECSSEVAVVTDDAEDLETF